MRHSSFSPWSRIPLRNRSSHALAKNQNAAGTWARMAELSGRGVPSRAQRSISARISGVMSSSGTYSMRWAPAMGPLLLLLLDRDRRVLGLQVLLDALAAGRPR